MAKAAPEGSKRQKRKQTKWIIGVFFVTVVVSGTISLMSDILMANSSMGIAFLVLLTIILIGILFDIIGMAVASADEKPFHAMASRKVPGARAAIQLLRNAGRVSSICNDVVGDICGVVSGSASATIAAQILANFEFTWPKIVGLTMSALCAGLTVGGKAIGKSYAVNSCTSIVHTVGKVIFAFQNLAGGFKKKKK